MGKSKGTGKAGSAGKVADKNATIALPGGQQVKLKNSPTGFVVSGAHYLQCAEGGFKMNPYDGQMEDGLGYGRRANNLPEKLWVSQNHGACTHGSQPTPPGFPRDSVDQVAPSHPCTFFVVSCGLSTAPTASQ